MNYESIYNSAVDLLKTRKILLSNLCKLCTAIQLPVICTHGKVTSTTLNGCVVHVDGVRDDDGVRHVYIEQGHNALPKMAYLRLNGKIHVIPISWDHSNRHHNQAAAGGRLLLHFNIRLHFEKEKLIIKSDVVCPVQI